MMMVMGGNNNNNNNANFNNHITTTTMTPNNSNNSINNNISSNESIRLPSIKNLLSTIDPQTSYTLYNNSNTGMVTPPISNHDFFINKNVDGYTNSKPVTLHNQMDYNCNYNNNANNNNANNNNSYNNNIPMNVEHSNNYSFRKTTFGTRDSFSAMTIRSLSPPQERGMSVSSASLPTSYANTPVQSIQPNNNYNVNGERDINSFGKVTKKTKGKGKGHASKCRNFTENGHKIPRPRNAFILFRQHLHHSIFGSDKDLLLTQGSFKANSQVSREIGNRWRELPPEEKNYWHELAKKEKELHKLKYPNYKYLPKKIENSSSEESLQQ
ncbi:hypothetical protein Kpol_1062p60 [Vanderwaltozyma polyspora DSM 70294]|uniref:HMG box domain-containing protein n=1 Tax=Vanderwaltozyma polyspora (strain ATCC 22028 / DSM 70294 / BCRC 21397 / CBS 2163 / NBRC 10782 / NRRL Y-8283 / UCD 57-17) TaxID=436907 RepID=A7TKB3_VANPO|nr:uncharacterized protein Kpol_1062p60 [Vanderwaltozyma polyspora DSM 70294]EDO17348.1 hypothetical protein Kpol_1062p60 [Vanderwaltozyma polyspora DSM 70294]